MSEKRDIITILIFLIFGFQFFGDTSRPNGSMYGFTGCPKFY